MAAHASRSEPTLAGPRTGMGAWAEVTPLARGAVAAHRAPGTAPAGGAAKRPLCRLQVPVAQRAAHRGAVHTAGLATPVPRRNLGTRRLSPCRMQLPSCERQRAAALLILSVASDPGPPAPAHPRASTTCIPQRAADPRPAPPRAAPRHSPAPRPAPLALPVPPPRIEEAGQSARPLRGLPLRLDRFGDRLFELRVVEVEVEALASDQVVVAALLDDLALVHDEDLVGVADR